LLPVLDGAVACTLRIKKIKIKLQPAKIGARIAVGRLIGVMERRNDVDA
jgi:hypothetical protein